MKRRKGKIHIVHIVPVFIFLLSQFSSVHIKAEERITQKWTLSFEKRPAQLLLNITGSNESHNVSIKPPQYGGGDKDYKISAVLLYMNVSNGAHGGNENENDFPFGIGQGSFPVPVLLPLPPDPNRPTISLSNSGVKMDHSVYYNYTEDSFNYPEVSNDTFVTITSTGEWKHGDWALVIFTIYYDETHCAFCSPHAFCCEPAQGCPDSKNIDLTLSDSNDGRTRVIQFKETIHEVSMKMHQSRFAGMKRCIPDSLQCNGFPNCGHFCNHDEADDVCNFTTELPCFNYECYWDMSFVWTALLAIVFFVISPTVVVFLICYHRQLTVMTRRRRHTGSDSSIVVHSPPNDLPPTYDELHGGMEEPPPCFCRATSMIDGIDNPAFRPEDSTTTMSVQKSGSISIPVIECSCNSNHNNNNNTVSAVTATVISPALPINTNTNSGDTDTVSDDKTESPRNPREIMTTTIIPFKSEQDNDNLESQNNHNVDSHV